MALGVHECISIDKNLHVSLTYNDFAVPFPEWFRYGHNCSFTRFSMLENFASYIRNKGIKYNIIFKELTNIQHYHRAVLRILV